MSDQLPTLTKVPSPGLLGRRDRWRQVATIVAILAAAAVGFFGGVNVASAPTARPSHNATVAAASPSPVVTFRTGLYHVTTLQAEALATLAGFYAAYDDGRLADALAALSPNPTVIDCDYHSRTIRTFTGVAVSTYLQGQLASGDWWSVDYQGQPETEIQLTTVHVTVIPRSRQSRELIDLGAIGGMKHDFAGQLFGAIVNARSLKITALDWGATDLSSATEAELCDPMR
jgi:hypothetical protein